MSSLARRWDGSRALAAVLSIYIVSTSLSACIFRLCSCWSCAMFMYVWYAARRPGAAYLPTLDVFKALRVRSMIVGMDLCVFAFSDCYGNCKIDTDTPLLVCV